MSNDIQSLPKDKQKLRISLIAGENKSIFKGVEEVGDKIVEALEKSDLDTAWLEQKIESIEENIGNNGGYEFDDQRQRHNMRSRKVALENALAKLSSKANTK